MPHKEHYRLNLPHYQQPGQGYFVTWCQNDAVPKHALKRYSEELKILKSQIGKADSDPLPGPADSMLPKETADWNRQHPGEADSDPLGERNADWNHRHPLLKKYYATRGKYIKAFNDLLDADKNPKINLTKPKNLKEVIQALKYWEEKKLICHAFCVMPNHVHWVVELFENDIEGELVYLEDILYSVKRFSATQINKLEQRSGKLWQKESFETTIRDEKHMYNAIEYTLNNPVNAGWVKNWRDWPGAWCR